jgi:hypothetical protein
MFIELTIIGIHFLLAMSIFIVLKKMGKVKY